MHENIGVVGAGVVGKALIAAFDGRLRIYVNDPLLGDKSTALEEIVAICDVVFITVPTPLGRNGDIDITAFGTVIKSINLSLSHSPYRLNPIICVRSAVPPDAIAEVISRWPNMRMVVSPEFLREASPLDDMINMRSLVLGGEPSACEVISSLFHHHSNVVGPIRTSILPDAIGAAFLKFQENSFLAMKVSFMNEFFEVFRQSGSLTTWEELQIAFHQDHERMGSTHWMVPGPDGSYGWGGRCLPKDTSAFRKYAIRLGIKTPLLEAVCNRNLNDRGQLLK